MMFLSILTTFKSILEYILIPALLGTGVFLTLRLGFVQFRYFWHGILVALGRYDDPSAPGEVSHFQALTTALSATVGIGNIAGVAIAIHWGGPGAIFWMWVTALLGMATKFTEVTLAQRFREVDEKGVIKGGPMYYMSKGLGKRWYPMAVFFALALTMAAFITGNAVQANTAADLLNTMYRVPPAWTGLIMAVLIGSVIIGGIKRIGKITQILGPLMALMYVGGGIGVLFINMEGIPAAFEMIFREAFNPTAGVAGTGAGVFLQTLLWGVRRGLFSNEAGQGSASIAHAAAKTDHPVSEGVVALLEPFIDTILICTITALTIITTGVWHKTQPTAIHLNGGDLTLRNNKNAWAEQKDLSVKILDGYPVDSTFKLAWHEVSIPRFFSDPLLQVPFSGEIYPVEATAISVSGEVAGKLYGEAVENGAPLTMWAFREGLGPMGSFIVVCCVLLFGISTAISWSYYGDQCIGFLFDHPMAQKVYRFVYILFHFLGSILALNTVWDLGDIAMSLATIPNVIALCLLGPVVYKSLTGYFLK